MNESNPEYGPPLPPTIPDGVLGELRVDPDRGFHVRHEIGIFVSRRFFDEQGNLKEGHAYPIPQIISDEVIAELDALSVA